MRGTRRLDPRSWPVTVTVPLIVVLLMLAIGTLLSQQVLRRLEDSQRSSLAALAEAYLDGLNAALLPSVLRQDTWEVFDALDRARDRYTGVNALGTVVVGVDGLVLAASDPKRFPSDRPLPAGWGERFPAEGLTLDAAAARGFVVRPLLDQGRRIGAIYAELDIAQLLAERRGVLWALVGTNVAITLLLAAIGYLLVRRVMRPVAVLAEHLSRGRDGPLVPVPEAAIGRERSAFARLFTQYNALVRAVNEREQLAQHLAEEERLASLGRLASGMAHEINNPLGGMQTLVDTLETHGERADVRRDSLALLHRGLSGIRDVVRSALATYKRGSGEADLVPSDLDDLRYLVQHEVARRRLLVQWDNRLPDRVPVNGGAVRQAALNLLLNACAATPVGGSVRLAAQVAAGSVRLEVADQGGGLPGDAAALLTARERLTPVPVRGSGLGLWMVSRLLRELGGTAEVAAEAGRGSRVTLTIPLRHGEALLGHVA